VLDEQLEERRDLAGLSIVPAERQRRRWMEILAEPGQGGESTVFLWSLLDGAVEISTGLSGAFMSDEVPKRGTDSGASTRIS
jgi:hypothetical protein